MPQQGTARKLSATQLKSILVAAMASDLCILSLSCFIGGMLVRSFIDFSLLAREKQFLLLHFSQTMYFTSTLHFQQRELTKICCSLPREQKRKVLETLEFSWIKKVS